MNGPCFIQTQPNVLVQNWQKAAAKILGILGSNLSKHFVPWNAYCFTNTVFEKYLYAESINNIASYFTHLLLAKVSLEGGLKLF